MPPARGPVIRKPKSRPATTVARAQERSYSSQGAAVQRQATAQRAQSIRQRVAATPRPPSRAARRSRARDRRWRPPADREAERFKGTRRYYADYRRASAPTRTSSARAPRSARAHASERVADTDAERRVALDLILGGKRAYERELRRGPDKLSTPAYERYADRLWERAKKFYPEPERQPKTKVDYGPGVGKDLNAWVRHDRPTSCTSRRG